MRVIAGSSRGRPLRAPAGGLTRPTADRVRESIFNVLGSLVDLEGTVVADLFAGSGAMGIEALSRGAASVVFVDSSLGRGARRAGQRDRHGARPRRHPGRAGRRARVAPAAPPVRSGSCDPPYAFDGWEELLGRLQAEMAVLESDRPVDGACDLGDHQEQALRRYARHGGPFPAVASRPAESHQKGTS